MITLSGEFLGRNNAGLICCALGILLPPAQALRPDIVWNTREYIRAELPAFGEPAVNNPTLNRPVTQGFTLRWFTTATHPILPLGSLFSNIRTIRLEQNNQH